MIQQFDSNLLYSIHSFFECGFLDFIMPLITSLGNGGIFWIAVSLFLICRRSTRKTGIAVAVSMLLCFIFGNLMLKNLIARPRPYTVDPSIVLLIPPSSEIYSFPSGHTMNAFSAAFSLMMRREKYYIPAIILAAVIAFSRIYLMMHYPLDILGGIAVGFTAAYISCRHIIKLYNSKL